MKTKGVNSHKYFGLVSGAWKCTHVGIARVQGARAKSAYHRSYYYIFERETSDKAAMKMVRLNAAQALQVRRGLTTVEAISKKKLAKKSNTFEQKVSYSFK